MGCADAARPSPAASAAARTAAVAGHLLRSPITTHVLDVASGTPAAGVSVRLCVRPPGAPAAAGVWAPLAAGETDADGRATALLPPGAGLPQGVYRLEFGTGAYAAAVWGAGAGPADPHPTPGAPERRAPFFPAAAVEFQVGAETPRHVHVPLTWAPYGYSTYRGS